MLKLSRYQLLVHISSLISLFLFILFAYLFPAYFAFSGNVEVFITMMMWLFSFHLVCYVLEVHTRYKIFFTISRYGWLIFFCSVVYISGGLDSPVLLFLIFPLLVSTVDLNVRDTAYVGIITSTFLLCLLWRTSLSPAELGIHTISAFLYTLIAYYVMQAD